MMRDRVLPFAVGATMMLLATVLFRVPVKDRDSGPINLLNNALRRQEHYVTILSTAFNDVCGHFAVQSVASDTQSNAFIERVEQVGRERRRNPEWLRACEAATAEAGRKANAVE